MMLKGKLYLIPCPIAEDNLESLPSVIAQYLRSINHFIVERARTSRRFIKALCPEIVIDDLDIFELDKRTPKEGLDAFLQKLLKGEDIGVMSEAGCPGVADPGNLAVQWCHQNDIKVVPLVGPSSILLALMASGMNGQNFAFNGYLPNKNPELVKTLRNLEGQVVRENQTQLFMDAPYRNTFLLESCIEALNPNTKLCIACDLDSPQSTVMVLSVTEWSKQNVDQFHKRPAIFVIGRW